MYVLKWLFDMRTFVIIIVKFVFIKQVSFHKSVINMDNFNNNKFNIQTTA